MVLTSHRQLSLTVVVAPSTSSDANLINHGFDISFAVSGSPKIPTS